MPDTEALIVDLGRAIAARQAAGRQIGSLREQIRSTCEHPIVVEGKGPSYSRQRVCLTCGTGEVGTEGAWAFLARPGRIVKTNATDVPELDDPNVEVQFLSWCRAGHVVDTRCLPYGWCSEHMPAQTAEQIAKRRAEEDRLNCPG